MLRGSEAAALQWGRCQHAAAGSSLVHSILQDGSGPDQAGQGQFVFLHDHTDARICPSLCLHRLASLSPLGSMSGPVFTTHRERSRQVSKSTMLTIPAVKSPHRLSGPYGSYIKACLELNLSNLEGHEAKVSMHQNLGCKLCKHVLQLASNSSNCTGPIRLWSTLQASAA